MQEMLSPDFWAHANQVELNRIAAQNIKNDFWKLGQNWW